MTTTADDAFAALLDTTLDSTIKGVPLGESVALKDVGHRGWNVARGDLALPVTTLRASALTHNIAAMAQYCRRHGALFAPHGKTTMAPQLFRRQLDAGAWAITAANPTQAYVMRKFGVPRIIIANEVTDRATLMWAHGEMRDDPSFELYFLVDNADAVAAADATLAAAGSAAPPMKVFLEVGVRGGRSGVRTIEEAIAVAKAVSNSRHLVLVGVETYEGLVTSGAQAEDLAALDTHLGGVRDTLTALDAHGLLEDAEEVYVTAGGSSYFDRVTAVLADWSHYSRPVRLVLRSGCYLSHDLGKYHALSPLDGRRAPSETLSLRNALEAWATVLSTPEPGLSILATGKRDVAHDLSLPTPLRIHRRDGTVTGVFGPRAQIVRLMDQHAFMRTDDDVVVQPGDIVAMGLSHPCTAFDKCRFIPVIDDDLTVQDAVVTFF